MYYIYDCYLPFTDENPGPREIPELCQGDKTQLVSSELGFEFRQLGGLPPLQVCALYKSAVKRSVFFSFDTT